MPPCRGHDLFEGVVQYDLALFLNYLVKMKKWFCYAYLNQVIVKFKYKGYDANDKPSIVNESGKTLGGHAVQNLCLLRLLPLLNASKIQDSSDKVWAAICLLREIVALVCAPKILVAQVTYLRVKVEEYLEARSSLFSEMPHSKK